MPKNLKTKLINEKTIQVLKKFMIFEELTTKEIKTILDMDSMSNGEESYQSRVVKLCEYHADETIIRQGEFDSWTFWVLTGIFEVIQEGEVIAVFSKPGEIFGEMSVLEGIPRTATVVAKNAGVCLCLDMSVIENLYEEKIKGVIRKGFYQVILSRLSKTKHQMKEEKTRLEKKYAHLIAFEQGMMDRADKNP